MRTGDTFLFSLWGAVIFVLAVVQLIKGKVSEAVPLGVMALLGFLLASGTWSLIGRQQRVWEEEKRQMAAVQPPVNVIPPPAGPIEMGEPAEVLRRLPCGQLVSSLSRWGWRYSRTFCGPGGWRSRWRQCHFSSRPEWHTSQWTRGVSDAWRMPTELMRGDWNGWPGRTSPRSPWSRREPVRAPAGWACWIVTCCSSLRSARNC